MQYLLLIVPRIFHTMIMIAFWRYLNVELILAATTLAKNLHIDVGHLFTQLFAFVVWLHDI